ncbi:MAG TPA: hypothetical protein VGL56_07180 [Fimbriimonadaceae bacterium]|jgi:hypothetical protein
MPTEIYEEPLELEVEVLEALAPEPGTPAFKDAYPLPALRRTGRFQIITFRSLVIENAFLRVVVVPELGGRILRILDKRTATEILGTSSKLDLVDGGPRGVESRAGIRWSAVDKRLDDLGPVDCQVVEPADDDDNGGVWLFSLVPGEPISVHVGISVPPKKCEILVEIQTYNRSFSVLPVRPHFEAHFSGPVQLAASIDAAGIYDYSERAGLQIKFDHQIVRQLTFENGKLDVGKFFGDGVLAPRQLDSWGFSLTPISAVKNLQAVGAGIAMGASEEQIELSSDKAIDGKLVILTSDGKTLEAPLSLSPDKITTLDIRGLTGPPIAAAVIDQSKAELLRWEANQPEALLRGADRSQVREPSSAEMDFGATVAKLLTSEHPEAVRDAFASLTILSDELGLRGGCYAAMGLSHLRAGDFEQAATFFDNALLYNGEDSLMWWLKAAASRLKEGNEGERPELLNAHFLAPLEPMLRAESFLSSPDNVKLLEALKHDSAALVEVACILYECRMFEDLTRWAHSALQQKEVPMLRYLLAAALLEPSKMIAEAASEVRLAGAVDIEPPYPWHATEIRALAKLEVAFPDDPNLKELKGFIPEAWAFCSS